MISKDCPANAYGDTTNDKKPAKISNLTRTKNPKLFQKSSQRLNFENEFVNENKLVKTGRKQ